MYKSVDGIISSSVNDLSPVQYQTNVWTNADLLSIEPYSADYGYILIQIRNYSFKKTYRYLKMSISKFCSSLEISSLPDDISRLEQNLDTTQGYQHLLHWLCKLSMSLSSLIVNFNNFSMSSDNAKCKFTIFKTNNLPYKETTVSKAICPQ